MTGYIEPKSKYSNFLGKRVMELCREKDMTIEEIANEIGMSRSSFYQYLSGKFEPKAATVYTFAKYFGVSADYLMGITSTREDNADLRKIGDCLKLNDKALETFLDLTDESCVYSASTCLEEATAAYWPAIPDPGNEDVEGKKYLTRFSKIYDISNNELFNELLSQKEWLQVPRFLNNFFILFNFERQLCVLLDCLTGWLRDHEDEDLELQGRVLEEANKYNQCLKEVRERKEYIFFKLQRILTQATENCAKQFSDAQAALNKKNADTILRELLGQEE